MPDEKNDQHLATSSEIHDKLVALGGIKVGHSVPVKGEKEIRLEHLGGRLILRSPFWVDSPDPTAKPAESAEDDARE